MLTVGLVVFPVSFAVSILRYRLWDIGVLINRTLVYGALTGTIVVTYLASILVLETVFRAATGQGGTLAVVVSTLAIAALFVPLRRRIQRIIDRRLYRSRYDAARTLQAFSVACRDEVDLERLSNALVGVVHDTLQPSHVSLWLPGSDAGPDRASGQDGARLDL